MKLKIDKVKKLLSTKIFRVEQVEFSDQDIAINGHYRIESADWVNILPITNNKEAVLVKQLRAGCLSYTLETPGGNVEENEKDTTMSALRELEEETGYTSQRILPLAIISPNPAIMTNRVHFFLALNCYENPNRAFFPDPHERLEIIKVKTSELDHLIRQGQINSIIAALCIMLAAKYLKD